MPPRHGPQRDPVDAVTIAALRALHDLQQIEAIDAVPAHVGTGHVAARLLRPTRRLVE